MADNQNLNRELRQLVIKMNKITLSGHILSQYYYDKFKRLVERGAVCKITKRLVETILHYKFSRSCIDAELRCKNKYQDTDYLLGYYKEAPKQLKKENPLAYDRGINVVHKYLYNAIKKGFFNKQLAPVVHRVNDNGHYEWSNIMIMSAEEHDQHHQKMSNEAWVVVYITKDGLLLEESTIKKIANIFNINPKKIREHEGQLMHIYQEGQKTDAVATIQRIKHKENPLVGF